MKWIISLIFATSIMGCAPTKYVTGDRFYTDIYVDNKVPFYKREGVYQGSDLYSVLPRWKEYEAQAGLLARKTSDPTTSIVVKPLSDNELNEIRGLWLAQQRQQLAIQKAAEERRLKEIEKQKQAKPIEIRPNFAPPIPEPPSPTKDYRYRLIEN